MSVFKIVLFMFCVVSVLFRLGVCVFVIIVVVIVVLIWLVLVGWLSEWCSIIVVDRIVV